MRLFKTPLLKTYCLVIRTTPGWESEGSAKYQALDCHSGSWCKLQERVSVVLRFVVPQTESTKVHMSYYEIRKTARKGLLLIKNINVT